MDNAQSEADAYNDAVAAILRERASELKYSYDRLVELTGLSRPTVSRLLAENPSGRRSELRASYIYRLTVALDLDIGEVMNSAARSVAE